MGNIKRKILTKRVHGWQTTGKFYKNGDIGLEETSNIHTDMRFKFNLRGDGVDNLVRNSNLFKEQEHEGIDLISKSASFRNMFIDAQAENVKLVFEKVRLELIIKYLGVLSVTLTLMITSMLWSVL